MKSPSSNHPIFKGTARFMCGVLLALLTIWSVGAFCCRNYTLICKVDIFDPWASPDEVKQFYGMESVNDISKLENRGYDAVVLAVAHREFVNCDLGRYLDKETVVYDIKGVLPREIVDERL